MSTHQPIKRFTISALAKFKEAGEKFNMITAYDSAFAKIFDEAGIPVILVGDSAGNNFLGFENTIPVTLEQMLILTASVNRAVSKALVVADLPFGSYQTSAGQAVESAIALVKAGGAQAVKLEGGQEVIPQIKAIIQAGIPVMGHIGLTPQSVNAIGGYKVQGRGESSAKIIADAKALADAGVFAIVLEMVPSNLAAEITRSISAPTIGIGAGNQTDGQVLVSTDLLGINSTLPKFVRKYLDLNSLITAAISNWIADTKSGSFPSDAESYL
jgi:3-methyl-2-oxobutanoate hydroxymethyltransferase